MNWKTFKLKKKLAQKDAQISELLEQNAYLQHMFELEKEYHEKWYAESNKQMEEAFIHHRKSIELLIENNKLKSN